MNECPIFKAHVKDHKLIGYESMGQVVIDVRDFPLNEEREVVYQVEPSPKCSETEGSIKVRVLIESKLMDL